MSDGRRSSPNAAKAAASERKPGKREDEKASSSHDSERWLWTKQSCFSASAPSPRSSSAVHVGRKRGVIAGATSGGDPAGSPSASFAALVRSTKASVSASDCAVVSTYPSGQCRSMLTLPISERGPPRSTTALTYSSEASRRAEPQTSAVVVPFRSMSSIAARYTSPAVWALSADSAGKAYFARNPSSAMSGRSIPVPM